MLSLKFTFSANKIAPPRFIAFMGQWIIVFHPLTFSLAISFWVRWVSCRQHMLGYCFLIHSASLFLLIGELRTFTLMVIAVIYWFILHMLSFCCYIFTFHSVSLSVFLSGSFLCMSECFSIFFVGLIWWSKNSSAVLCHGSILFLHPFWRTVLQGTSVWVGSRFL